MYYNVESGGVVLNNKIAVVGGDLRQAVLASLLAAEGAEVAVFALEGAGESLGNATLAADLEGAVRRASAVVLPLPFSRDGKQLNAPLSEKSVLLSELVGRLEVDAVVLGGMMDKEAFKGFKCFDYYELEEFKLLNAVPTAEGAISVAMASLKTTLHGSSVLILGCGRIGRVLAADLRALGASVSFALRNDVQAAWCEINGFKTLSYDELASLMGGFDLIYNTVPCVLIKGEVLEAVRSDSPVIDLASKPFGVDYARAAELGKNVINAQGLPAKVAPLSAGRIIKQSICNILKKERII